MKRTAPVLPDGRRYEILDVIGRGGFGNVYRARLEGGDGFFKDVAIKIARDADAPREALERFRDEARILGLVRDRALVNVDPPMRLDGRWAVVMEYVEGASCSRLVVRFGCIPPTVCMEIGAEIARVLHKIYRHPGRDGQPLRLVHRDIKPANIQITPTGEVKLLDFGIARAEFRDRESVTVMTIGGTRGYIAPERTTGLEAPSGDVYSLGVVLHKIVTGKLPDEHDLGWENGEPEPSDTGTPKERVLALSRRMRALRPSKRPTADEVRVLLTDMRRDVEGDSLQEWAERVVPEVTRLAEDDMVGCTLTEETDNPNLRRKAPLATGPRWPRMLLAVVLLSALVVAVGLGTRNVDPQQELRPVFVPEPADPPSAPSPAPSPEPEPVAPPPVAPARQRPRSVAPAEPEPVDAMPVAPVPEVLTLHAIRITSIPMGAAVKVDGRVVGNTPLLSLKVAEGSHQVEISSDQALIRRKITVGSDHANRFVWRIGAGTWEEGF